MEEKKILKFECGLDKIFYPKYSRRVESGEFAIFKVSIGKWLENEDPEISSVKIKGNPCSLEYGPKYKVVCQLADTHERYGDTYKLIYMNKCADVSDKEKQKEFLGSILNKKIVEELFEEYDDVEKLLERNDVESLTKVKGVGVKTAMKMVKAYKETKDYSDIYTELGGLGLSGGLIEKLVGFYSSPETVVKTARNNPYDFMRIDGIGFKKADEIACKVGIGQFDVSRIKAFLRHHLNEQGEAGKSYLSYKDVMSSLYDALGFVPEGVMNEAAKQMLSSGEIMPIDGGEFVALKKFHDLENGIAAELMRLLHGRNKIQDYVPRIPDIKNHEEALKKVEEEQGFSFTDEQAAAVKMSMDFNVVAITGLAGSGKTSTAKGICSLYEGCRIFACALSGKAGVRIKEATGIDSSTIHKGLGYSSGEFKYDRENKLAADIVLVDEATMINGTLFLSLLEAIPAGAKVILMGDVQQLTPIGNCQVFHDVLESGVIPVARLTKPHRQALMGGIIPASIKVANQEQIFPKGFEGKEVSGGLDDMVMDISVSKDGMKEKIIRYFKEEIKKYGDVMEVQVCVPMKMRGDLSCYRLNVAIQGEYNPGHRDGKSIEVFFGKKGDEVLGYSIFPGDKVINTKNNYRCLDANGREIPVFNGNMGIVKEITKEGFCTVDFVGIGEVTLEGNDSKNLELGYACTVHKSQGSGFTSVIVGMDSGSYILNNSELLYTAITRAEKRCILVGENKAVSRAIKMKEVNTKQTFLKKMLIRKSQENEKTKGE